MARLVLLGSTASGKTEVSLPLAENLGAEIVSVDSRQVYRGMKIGSAAPSPEQLSRVRHHLVGTAEPEETLSAGEYGRRARETEAEIRERGREVLFVGGSGLYLRGVLGGLNELPRDEEVRTELGRRAEAEGSRVLHAELALHDPETADVVGEEDTHRILRALEILELTGEKPSVLRERGKKAEAGARIVVLNRVREDLEDRIRRRVAGMVGAGLEDEVRALLDRGLSPDIPAFRSVGFAETLRFLRGETTRGEWTEEIVVNTRRLAKRQRTWFRGLPRARWIQAEPGETADAIAGRVEFPAAES